jgi:hypothetical protein
MHRKPAEGKGNGLQCGWAIDNRVEENDRTRLLGYANKYEL